MPIFPMSKPLAFKPGIAGISSEKLSVIPPEVAVKLIRSGIAGKNNRSYNYHHRKLYRMMEGNTCAIQAKVKDLMLETLDGLV